MTKSSNAKHIKRRISYAIQKERKIFFKKILCESRFTAKTNAHLVFLGVTILVEEIFVEFETLAQVFCLLVLVAQQTAHLTNLF